MAIPPITPQLVEDLWAYMQSEFNSKVVPKNASKLMGAVGSFLGTFGILSKQKFLKNYVTTIHRTIYVPFEVGGNLDSWSLRSQLRLAVHEHQHIVQGDRDGWLYFDSKYVASSTARATYEAEANASEMELEVYIDPTIDLAEFARRRAQSLKNYACSEQQIQMVERMLLMRAPIIKHGIVETKAANKAIRWLQAYERNKRQAKG